MKRWRTVLVVLGVVLALLVAAEFGIRALVQSQARQAIAGADLDLEQPTLTLDGGSLVFALARGRFVDVSGTASSAVVPFEEHEVTVRALSFQAGDIRLVGLNAAVIGDLRLSGTLDYAGLSELAGLPVTQGRAGRVLVTYTVDVLGLHDLQIGISAVPVLNLASQQVELEQSRIEVAGIDLTEGISQQIISRVVKPISLAVDDRVRVTSITVADDGLVVGLTATDVAVRR
ncbi:LmeA family phospholipid-binding protein [Micropruina sp.]|uniref:LmeA family phospholipid-binding protein n=1 Tax=Micropruina sp. TaxID=2737536 RepID=UPI0039E5984A